MKGKVYVGLIFSLLCVFAFSACLADGAYTIEQMRQDHFERLMEDNYLDEGVTIEGCFSAIDIPIHEMLKSSALVQGNIYLLANECIYRIDADRNMTSLQFADDISAEQRNAFQQLFEFDDALYALLSFRAEEPLLTSEYVKIDIQDDVVHLGESILLDTGFYQEKDGLAVGRQSSLCRSGSSLFSLDYPTNKNMGSFIEYDILTGKGKEIAVVPGCYDLIVYNDRLLSLHECAAYLSQVADVTQYIEQCPSSRLLLQTNLATGEWEIIQPLDGVPNTYAGQPMSMIYDAENDDLYYCMKGKLHRVHDLDFSTDTIIADAPGNWLQLTGCHTKSFLTEGYYVEIIPHVGVDYIPIPEA